MNKVLFFSNRIEPVEPIIETCKSKNIFFIQRDYQNIERISYGLFNVVLCYFETIDEDAVKIIKGIRKHTSVPIGIVTYTSESKLLMHLHKKGVDKVFDANLLNNGLADELTTFIYRYKYLSARNETHIVRINGFTFDFNRLSTKFHNEPIDLTPKQHEVLLLFLTMDGHILTKDFIIKTLWPHHNPASDNALVSLISRINREFSEVADVKPIDLVYGFGYRLNTAIFD